MAIYKTYEQIGLAEDVSNIISDITPTDTPMYSMIKTEKVHARQYQYMTDTLAAAASNAQLEGFTASAGTAIPTVMINGNTQILQKTFQVSATADAVKAYGRAKETAYQLSKALKEIKKDVEHAFVGASNATVAGNATTAREMASADQLIDSSVSTDAGSNSTDALTEAKLLVNMQAVYEAGGEPSILMVKPADSLIIAGFTGASGRTRDFNDGTTTLTNVVNLYVSPFGEYKVVLNRHQMSTHAFLLDPSMWRTAVLRPFARTLLAKTGDSDTHMVVGEMGLMHKNPKGSGQITGLS
jgi:hypothetical protein